MELTWERLWTFNFAHPWLLLLLGVIPALIVLWGRSGPVVAVRYSSLELVRDLARNTRSKLGRPLIRTLFFTGMAFVIVALARPRLSQGVQDRERPGIDIMLVLDFSYSMQEGKIETPDEGEITYFQALKRITGEFIRERPNDRLGVIGFAVRPYSVSPLTSNHKFVLDSLDRAELDLGTAIGSAMYYAAKELQYSERTTRIMVVVTDGDNNIGLDPETAALYARGHGIRIYPVKICVDQPLKPERIAAEPLHRISNIAEGSFFQATDYESLSGLMTTIELLEKSYVKEELLVAFEQVYMWFLLPGLVLVTLGFFLEVTLLRRLP